MIALLVLFGVLVAVAVSLVVVLLRRKHAPTETAEGLLIEQEARLRAHHSRVSFNSRVAHNSTPTMGDSHHRQ
ncbi:MULTISPECIES: hypothetical protein [unclassified Streptomyces]|nr:MULTISPECIES: hypothetical protein [unclassified Streptomyces]AEN14253.1 hypothetical protein SACTE_6485 [Streptomyces sp. SirexAA-E]MYR66730.1 hypothetical protein [Streptomyces sp. SID4939]MYS03538.1 hypothetical protein [Streptomyces sp. SID4940]MYT65942.1 hypothetical protein [Streptomyces sp. SID8357]MYT85544.1 hypothetical protein [Streptomyces sp. SID8360]